MLLERYAAAIRGLLGRIGKWCSLSIKEDVGILPGGKSAVSIECKGHEGCGAPG